MIRESAWFVILRFDDPIRYGRIADGLGRLAGRLRRRRRKRLYRLRVSFCQSVCDGYVEGVDW